MTAKISIIVPVYNQLRYLPQCAESLLCQTFKDFEVIFVDDASTDGSGEWIKNSLKDERIKIFRNEWNIGPGLSRNRGLKVAEGEFIRFVDADDIIPPDSTMHLLSAAENSGLYLVRGNLEMFDTSEPKSRRVCLPVGDASNLPYWQHPNLSIPWLFTSFLFRRDLIWGQPLWFPNLRMGEDPVFLARMLSKAENVTTIHDSVYLCRSKEGRKEQYNSEKIRDYLWHGGLVKAIFGNAGHPECFTLYSKILGPEIQWILEHSSLLVAERSELQSIVVNLLWGDLPASAESRSIFRRALKRIHHWLCRYRGAGRCSAV